MDGNSLFGDHPRHYVVTHRFDPEQLELIMSTITDALTTAVGALTTSVDGLTTQVQATGAEIASLKGGPDQTAVSDATTAIAAQQARVDAAAAALKGE